MHVDNIRAAMHYIDGTFTRTPQYECESLGEALGCRLTVKVETLNPLRSFKGRGADFLLCELERDGVTSLVTASAGNWGQAVAYGCRARGWSSIVFASTTASPLKLDRMRRLGADVRLIGEHFDEAKLEAARFCREAGGVFIEDGREPAIVEGHGTIALELTAAGSFDDIVAPLGNGALINGIGLWMRERAPQTQIIGVCASGAPCMAESFRAGAPVQAPEPVAGTIADGIDVWIPVPEAVADMGALVDDVHTVDDELLMQAMTLVRRHVGILVEPAAAAGVAAVLADRSRFAGRSVAVVLTGSNVSDASG